MVPLTASSYIQISLNFVFRAIDSCYFIFVLVMNKNYALV